MITISGELYQTNSGKEEDFHRSFLSWSFSISHKKILTTWRHIIENSSFPLGSLKLSLKINETDAWNWFIGVYFSREKCFNCDKCKYFITLKYLQLDWWQVSRLISEVLIDSAAPLMTISPSTLTPHWHTTHHSLSTVSPVCRGTAKYNI